MNKPHYWFATENIEKEYSYAIDLTALKKRFHAWHPDIEMMLSSTPLATITSLPIQELKNPLCSFISTKLVLLGDAAHAMTPNLGQGANQGFEDVAQLYALIPPAGLGAIRLIDLQILLRKFDELRRPRAQKVARQSRVMGIIGQIENRQLANIRNFCISKINDRFLNKSADGLMKWEP